MVTPTMGRQVGGLDEGRGAQAAHVGPLARVPAVVVVQVELGDEGGRALVAGEGPVPKVEPLVASEIVRPNGHVRALGALERGCIGTISEGGSWRWQGCARESGSKMGAGNTQAQAHTLFARGTGGRTAPAARNVLSACNGMSMISLHAAHAQGRGPLGLPPRVGAGAGVVLRPKNKRSTCPEDMPFPPSLLPSPLAL